MDDTTLIEMGKRIRQLREDSKMSQLDLAIAANVQPSAISDYENGKRNPSVDKLKSIARALYVTPDYLLGIDTDPDEQPEEEEPKNPIRDEVLEDEEFWKSRGIFPPTEEEKKHLRDSYSFRITFKNLDELKRGYQDIYVYLLQKEREKKSR